MRRTPRPLGYARQHFEFTIGDKMFRGSSQVDQMSCLFTMQWSDFSLAVVA